MPMTSEIGSRNDAKQMKERYLRKRRPLSLEVQCKRKLEERVRKKVNMIGCEKAEKESSVAQIRTCN